MAPSAEGSGAPARGWFIYLGAGRRVSTAHRECARVIIRGAPSLFIPRLQCAGEIYRFPWMLNCLHSISLSLSLDAATAAYLLLSYLHCREILFKHAATRVPCTPFKARSAELTSLYAALGIKRKSADRNNCLPGVFILNASGDKKILFLKPKQE